jgi:hypothetical protein
VADRSLTAELLAGREASRARVRRLFRTLKRVDSDDDNPQVLAARFRAYEAAAARGLDLIAQAPAGGTWPPPSGARA